MSITRVVAVSTVIGMIGSVVMALEIFNVPPPPPLLPPAALAPAADEPAAPAEVEDEDEVPAVELLEQLLTRTARATRPLVPDSRVRRRMGLLLEVVGGTGDERKLSKSGVSGRRLQQ
jgi:hypothetical protein